MSENEILTNQTTEETQQIENQQYIDAIRDLKANTVSKERYDKLMEENKNLLNSLVNGESVATATPAQQELPPIQDLVDEMRGKHLSDIEFVEKALEFRDRVLEETGEDCFVSKGHNITPSQESYIAAQRTADIYRECLDYANGDNKVFINELMRRMPNDGPVAQSRYKR